MMHLLLLERITLSNATQPATAALLSGKVNTVATVNTRRLASSLRVFYIAFHDKVIFVNVFHGKVFRCFKSLAISHPYGRQQICYLRNVRRWYVVTLYVRHQATGDDDYDAGVGRKKHMLDFFVSLQ